MRGAEFPAALRKARTALADFGIEGTRTNISFLRELLSDSQLQSGWVTTSSSTKSFPSWRPRRSAHQHDTRVAAVELYPGEEALRAQLAGTVVELAAEGAEFAPGEQLVVLEAMKMQHVLVAPDALRTARTLVAVGQVVGTGDPLLTFIRTGTGADGESGSAAIDLDQPRADLDEVAQRHLLTRDEGREKAVTKRHSQGRRTARENIDDLVDDGSFVEYGALAIAAQRSRRSEEDLIANTPADGLVAGCGHHRWRRGRASSPTTTPCWPGRRACATTPKRTACSTWPAENGCRWCCSPRAAVAGPGDTDVGGHAGLDVPTFRMLAGLSGQVPLVVDRLRPLLRRQCRAGRGVRRDHRDPGRQHRDGRARR